MFRIRFNLKLKNNVDYIEVNKSKGPHVTLLLYYIYNT